MGRSWFVFEKNWFRIKSWYWLLGFPFSFVLCGCAYATPPSELLFASEQGTKNEGSYKRVITGAFGFKFGTIEINVLKELGFEELSNFRYYSDVGKWTRWPDNKEEFFNLYMELVVSPISRRLSSIKGNRFYGSGKYIDHFDACMDDYRAIIVQLKNKYPTLVLGDLSRFKRNEYSTSWYYEGLKKKKYSKNYLGRFIVVKCVVQKMSGEKIVGSLLSISYHEESEVYNNISHEQKEVFKNKSKQNLEKKGLGLDKL